MNQQDTRWTGKRLALIAGFCVIIVLLLILGALNWREIQSRTEPAPRLIIYASSTHSEVLTQGIFPAFQRIWKAETGQDLRLEGVFGPSGTLSVQITQGAPADIAIFNNQRHIDWLKYNRRVNRDTHPLQVASTQLVILTRPDNPHRISDFGDLAQPGLRLLHGDPMVSGIGEWGLLAEYGSIYLESLDESRAESRLKEIWQNVRLLGSSARSTLTIFELGAGDALVTYEQDAALAQERRVDLEIVVPPRTILARDYAMIIDRHITTRERPAVEAFMAFILSDAGQDLMSQYYFRPVDGESEYLPALVNPFTEEDLGGWTQAYNRIIESFWKTEIEPGLNLLDVASLRVR